MIVFVHGVPETAAYWDLLRAEIDEPSVALSLPGFGCQRPDGFTATKDAYVDWLVGELAAMDEPVDLVGHDWGAGFTYRLVTTHPELVRTWAADVATIVHPDQKWHDFAQVWQTPGDGEAFIEAQLATPPEDQAPTFEEMGMTREAALATVSAMDATMGACILDLYRSAVPNTYASWGAEMGPVGRPGMVIDATGDGFSSTPKSVEVAEMLGAEVGTLEGRRHFWAVEDPSGAAALLTEFWARAR
ncbi:MAG: alpha/beta hydrolase [Microthrixaceae bacterium]|nr:alpha/beta hydrolase [Microthrixaceae bacterium]